MTFQDKLKRVGNAFCEAVPNCYHYWRPKMQQPYLIWAEDGENGHSADNVKSAQAVTGVADYYTKQEYDPAVDAIQAAMNIHGIAWRLDSVQFEETTGLIHYSWDWEVA